MKRGKLRIKGVSSTADLKDEIQSTARQIVIIRDGGCILRNYTGLQTTPFGNVIVPPCNGYRKDGEMILQADHLLTRSNTATYADTRLIVCVCKGHHGWKSVGSNLRKDQYDAVVKTILPKQRVDLWERCERERWQTRSGPKTDLKLELLALKQQLQNL